MERGQCSLYRLVEKIRRVKGRMTVILKPSNASRSLIATPLLSYIYGRSKVIKSLRIPLCFLPSFLSLH